MTKKITTIFTHIQKTAGITLHLIIERQYIKAKSFTAMNLSDLKRYTSLSLRQKQKIEVIKGHLPFGIDQYCPNPVEYYTILREPIERAISNYNYMGVHNREMMVKKYTLKQTLENGMSLNMDNCQVRYLSGKLDVPYGGITDEHLQVAIHNLKTRYSVIGLTQFFDASVLLMAKKFNWSTPFYIKENVTRVKVKDTPVDSETQTLLEHYNRYDKVLYETACEIFNNQLKQAGPDFEKEVTTFIEKNRKRKFRNKIEGYMGYILVYANPYNFRNLFYNTVRRLKIRIWFIYKSFQ